MPLNEPKISVPKLAIWVTVALIAGFLVGFLLEYVKVRKTEAELERVQYEVTLAQLRDKLGQAHLDVMARNFGNAQARTAEFFTRVQALTAANFDPSLQSSLTGILQQREEVMKLLSQSSPLAEPKIRQILNEVYRTTLK